MFNVGVLPQRLINKLKLKRNKTIVQLVISQYWQKLVLESIVHHQLYEYLEENTLLKEEQVGFRPNGSTQDILLRTIDDWKATLAHYYNSDDRLK